MPTIEPATILVVVAALGIVVWGPLGAWVASQKRRGGTEGFILGLIFGPFGVLVEALLPTGIGPPPDQLIESIRKPTGKLEKPDQRYYVVFLVALAAFVLLMLAVRRAMPQ